ncbi:MAG: PDZ domain-containing protein [Acidimicrobiia bacterium]
MTAQTVNTTDEPPTVAADPPTAATELQGSEIGATAPPAAAAVAPSTDDRGRGVFVPAWVAVVVGVLLIAGLGFAIGWAAAPGDSDSSNAVSAQPGGRNGSNQVPSFPGNGNGNSSGGSTTPPATTGGAFVGVSVDSAANDGGATITAVSNDSPAADAGLKEGDVITAVDGTKITSSLDLVRQIRSHDPGDTITVTYTRGGSSSDVKVKLETRSTTSTS